MEKGDKKLLRLWTNFRKISIAEFKKVYERLGIKFDTYIGESYFAGETDKIVEECLEKKTGQEDSETGRHSGGKFGGVAFFLLRKKDDSGLYITRDLVALIFQNGGF